MAPRKLTIDDCYRRNAENVAALNAGRSPDDPARVWTHGEHQPERDYFSLWSQWTDDTRTDVHFVACHDTLASYRRFNAIYGHHEPTCCWSYQPPAGVEVVTDEPDDWSGWRAPAIAEPMAPGQLELALSTVRAA